ncbi:TNF superfamily member 12 eiger isoform X2 [Oratosquilla oratoria]|uniref:TNF superfamily member 12 eiger isoform X2 n=1 Tax=Oratosquilla oratoria TaxID=337810 RepID=UPI003F768DAE
MTAMTEKPPLYTILPRDPPGGPERRWAWWLAGIAGLCTLGLMAVALSLVVSHEVRVDLLEERIEVLERQLRQVAHISVNGHDYFEYDTAAAAADALLDDKDELDELTVQGVLRRRRREANPETSSTTMTVKKPPVPIYDQSYGIDLKTGQRNEGLRLYGSLLDGKDGSDGPSAIKPYHRVSNLWSSKPARKSERKHKRYHTGRASSYRPIPNLHRQSRVKVTEGSHYNSVVFRTTTSTTTPAPTRRPFIQLVKQEAYTRKDGGHKSEKMTDKNSRKMKRPTKRQRRRRRLAPEITVAHFMADTSNYTVGGSGSYQGSGRLRSEGSLHQGWRPAPWMERLGLNKKYKLEDGVVTVKQAGLYYVYAQILYHDGHDLSGFQVQVDQTPVLQCTIMMSDITMAEKANSCHTAGTTYIPQGGRVTVRDIEPHRFALMKKEKSFFGLIRLMDAPHVPNSVLLA